MHRLRILGLRIALGLMAFAGVGWAGAGTLPAYDAPQAKATQPAPELRGSPVAPISGPIGDCPFYAPNCGPSLGGGGTSPPKVCVCVPYGPGTAFPTPGQAAAWGEAQCGAGSGPMPPVSPPPSSAPPANNECKKEDRIQYALLEQNESGGNPPTVDGYVPGHGKGVGAKSGVTVGYGVDLGQQSMKDLKEWGIDKKLRDKLKGYLGKTGTQAELYLNGDKHNKAHNLTLTQAEVDELDNGARNFIIGKLRVAFNKDNTGHVDFDQLPSNTQTALSDFFYQHGAYSNKKYQKLWAAVKVLDWVKVAKLLPLEPGAPRSRLQHDGDLVSVDVKAGRFSKKGTPVC